LNYRALVALVAGVVCGCKGNESQGDSSARATATISEGRTLSHALNERLRIVAGAKVFFGHQSVGTNLLNGLVELASRAEAVDLSIVARDDQSTAGETAFQHARIGKNGDPTGKVDHFVALIDSLGDARPDVALMKFCYLDLTAETDVDALVSYYSEAISGLKARHPDIAFAHITVPLTQRETSIKRLINRLTGRGNDDLENVRRQQFNQRLLKLFESDPIFDLARAESTRPDGSLVRFNYHGKSYPALNPDYTTDGAHLNESGRAIAAAEFARVIAAAASRRNQGG
jgi:hypothetical protein